jgi:hypothetical protein
MGHQDYKVGQQGYKLAGPCHQTSPCGYLATTVILLVGAWQFELWKLILTVTLSKKVEMD